jgi:uncharacterized membrane protein YdjX (TVP38/TMEM64 family)
VTDRPERPRHRPRHRQVIPFLLVVLAVAVVFGNMVGLFASVIPDVLGEVWCRCLWR